MPPQHHRNQEFFVAGRHQSAARSEQPRRRAPLAIVLVTLAAAVLGVGLSVAALEYPTSSSPADAAAATKCTTRPALTVVAAPQIAPAIQASATGWLAGRPAIGGACPTITVHSTDSAAEEKALSQPGAALPDLWIPDSTVWVTRLDAATAGAALTGEVGYPSIASSPLVIATTAGHQTALNQVAAQGWRAVLTTTSTPMAIVDPATNTDGLLALLTLDSTSGAANDGAAGAALTTLAKDPIAKTAEGLVDLRTHPAMAPSFAASEQEVVTANVGTPDGGTPVAVAVYPSGPNLALDFPVVQFSPSGSDRSRPSAAAAFVSQLSQPAAQGQLARAGLRDAAGDPLTADVSALGAAPQTVTLLAPPAGPTIDAAVLGWTKAVGK
jgi:hypothetical protein